MGQEWGPWIKHDGNPVPHLSGLWVQTINIGSFGKVYQLESRVITGFGRSWTWAEGFAKAIRYRIRKPRGLTILEDLIADLPQPATPKVPA